MSANNGGWQWASGSGTDAQPYLEFLILIHNHLNLIVNVNI